MTDAALLVADFRSQGIRVELDDDAIRCHAPKGVLTPDHARRLKALKPQVKALLKDEEYDIAWRVEAIWARVPADGPLPKELTVGDREPETGRCRSCGDPQNYGQSGKCTLCCLASVRVWSEAPARFARDLSQEKAS